MGYCSMQHSSSIAIIAAMRLPWGYCCSYYNYSCYHKPQMILLYYNRSSCCYNSYGVTLCTLLYQRIPAHVLCFVCVYCTAPYHNEVKVQQYTLTC